MRLSFFYFCLLYLHLIKSQVKEVQPTPAPVHHSASYSISLDLSQTSQAPSRKGTFGKRPPLSPAQPAYRYGDSQETRPLPSHRNTLVLEARRETRAYTRNAQIVLWHVSAFHAVVCLCFDRSALKFTPPKAQRFPQLCVLLGLDDFSSPWKQLFFSEGHIYLTTSWIPLANSSGWAICKVARCSRCSTRSLSSMRCVYNNSSLIPPTYG